jgi:hypothetical protein
LALLALALTLPLALLALALTLPLLALALSLALLTLALTLALLALALTLPLLALPLSLALLALALPLALLTLALLALSLTLALLALSLTLALLALSLSLLPPALLALSLSLLPLALLPLALLTLLSGLAGLLSLLMRTTRRRLARLGIRRSLSLACRRHPVGRELILQGSIPGVLRLRRDLLRLGRRKLFVLALLRLRFGVFPRWLFLFVGRVLVLLVLVGFLGIRTRLRLGVGRFFLGLRGPALGGGARWVPLGTPGTGLALGRGRFLAVLGCRPAGTALVHVLLIRTRRAAPLKIWLFVLRPAEILRVGILALGVRAGVGIRAGLLGAIGRGLGLGGLVRL